MSLTIERVKRGDIDPLLGLASAGQENGEGRPLIELALNLDGPAVLLNDPPGDRKPKAGALFFCGKERLEQARNVFRRDADAAVCDAQTKVVFFRHSGRAGGWRGGT